MWRELERQQGQATKERKHLSLVQVYEALLQGAKLVPQPEKEGNTLKSFAIAEKQKGGETAENKEGRKEGAMVANKKPTGGGGAQVDGNCLRCSKEGVDRDFPSVEVRIHLRPRDGGVRGPVQNPRGGRCATGPPAVRERNRGCAVLAVPDATHGHKGRRVYQK